MIKLLLNWLFLSISFITNAATIKPNDLSAPPAQYFNQKNKLVQPTTQILFFTNNDILFLSKNAFIQQQKAHQIPSHNLKSFVKKIDKEYGDNELVQESLTALYGTKQLWDEADAMANNFTYDLLFTLHLDKFIENDLSQSPQTASAYIFTKNNQDSSIQYHKTSDISALQIQQNHAKTSAYDSEEIKANFFFSLFHISTLYYFTALYILLMFLQWLIRFILRLLP